MRKLIASLALFSAAAGAAPADDAKAILAKAHAAFVENSGRERFWNWTTFTTRSVVDKGGAELAKLPTVTVESPIRSDGKRCNALLAWGDGVEPYLANATADERCAVEKEAPETFQMEVFLDSRQVKIQSQNAHTITLTIREDKQAMESTDPVKRCVASVRGTVQVDPATFFPLHIEVTMPGHECLLTRLNATNHYDDTVLKNVNGGSTKGTFIRNDYELQKDRAGDAKKDFWIVVHRYSDRPLMKNSSALIVSGRRFPIPNAGERNVVLESRTTAAELSAESLIKFETEKDK